MSLRRSFVTFAAVNASLGAFLFFYVLTVFNPIQEILQNTIFPDASVNEISFLASSPYLGAVLGALTIERIGKRFGRRSTMILTKTISIVGVILTLLSNLPLMAIGRILTGFDGGAAGVLVNIYITEICEDPLRGQLGVIPSIAAAFGTLLAFLLGTILPFFINREVADFGCKMLLALPGVISLIIILNLLFLFKFETPFYLVSQQKEREAKEVLQLLYDDEFSAKLRRIILERDYILEEKGLPLLDLFRPKYRKAFFVSLCLNIAPIVMGGSSFCIFSSMIFSEGEPSYYSTVPIVFSNLMGLMSLLGALLILLIMSYYSQRKTFVTTGLAVLVAINFALTIIAFFSSMSSLVIKILIVFWVLVFGLTLGPISSLYPAETLPETGVGLTIAFGQGSAFLVTQIFLPIKNALGFKFIFLAFTVFGVIMAIILSKNMIESKNRTKLELLRLYGAGNEKEEEEQEERMSILAKTH